MTLDTEGSQGQAVPFVSRTLDTEGTDDQSLETPWAPSVSRTWVRIRKTLDTLYIRGRTAVGPHPGTPLYPGFRWIQWGIVSKGIQVGDVPNMWPNQHAQAQLM